MSQPALLPQVYVHFDPLTRRHREILSKPRRLARERMDFLLLLPGGVRIVIEVDGKHHYAREVPKGSGCWVAAPDLYSEMVAEDRALRLKGYEVFRFGARSSSKRAMTSGPSGSSSRRWRRVSGPSAEARGGS